MSSVCWVVSDIVEETARLAGHQCPVVMQGNIFDETFRTTWFDTSAMLGCYAEVFIEHLTLRMSLARCREAAEGWDGSRPIRSEEHTSELQSLMRISYAVFCLKKKKQNTPYDNKV